MKYFWCKDADIPADVAAIGGLGIVGSDVLSELEPNDAGRLTVKPIAPIVDANGTPLSFRLLARTDAIGAVESKIYSSEILRIGTSYPRTAGRVLGALATTDVVCRGGAEALPYKYGELDAIFEAVQSGNSAKLNGLVEVDVEIAQSAFAGYGESEMLCAVEPTNREML